MCIYSDIYIHVGYTLNPPWLSGVCVSAWGCVWQRKRARELDYSPSSCFLSLSRCFFALAFKGVGAPCPGARGTKSGGEKLKIFQLKLFATDICIIFSRHYNYKEAAGCSCEQDYVSGALDQRPFFGRIQNFIAIKTI